MKTCNWYDDLTEKYYIASLSALTQLNVDFISNLKENEPQGSSLIVLRYFQQFHRKLSELEKGKILAALSTSISSKVSACLFVNPISTVFK